MSFGTILWCHTFEAIEKKHWYYGIKFLEYTKLNWFSNIIKYNPSFFKMINVRIEMKKERNMYRLKEYLLIQFIIVSIETSNNTVSFQSHI